ncbi:MAG: hypothetical protein M1840_002382 [Geoglossum simile]|nr:MAG: hypothetical protein M1840_002382 [Geoglossum simile]
MGTHFVEGSRSIPTLHQNGPSSNRKQGKFTLMAGSYSTFQAFFALTDLASVGGDFFGLPDYASTMAFELFTTKNTTAFPSSISDLSVRFLVRNGTDRGPIAAYPPFGRKDTSMPWTDFVTEIGKISIGTAAEWCRKCNATIAFCRGSVGTSPPAPPHADSVSRGKISNTVPGAISEMVSLGVMVVLAVVFLLWRRSVGAKGAAQTKEGSLGKCWSLEPRPLETTISARHPHSAVASDQPTQAHLTAPSGQVRSGSGGSTPGSLSVSLQDIFPNRQVYGLRVLHQPAEPVVDIIFIHGLTGNSYDAWLEAKSGIYWPIQLLGRDVPDARIMSFGYDADSDRKIVLVVHSLGGLVAKKALCLSEQSVEPHLKQLDRCAIAAAFLDTPHRGSGHTPFASGIANILKAGGKRVNANVLQFLSRDSEVLADTEGSFGIWLRRNSSRFNIACFVEELELPLIGMVVTKDSAKIDGYPQLSIRANHMARLPEFQISSYPNYLQDMTRFSTPDHEGYRRILGEVKRWIRPLSSPPDLKRELTQGEEDCLRSLSFPEMNDRRNDVNAAAGGTCAWLLQYQKYKDWAAQPLNLLWIKGKPGAGKSTLLKYVLHATQVERSSPSNLHIISFFCHGRGTEIQRTPLGLFRSLLHQLLDRFPNALASLVQTFKSRCQTMDKPGKDWKWHAQELEDFVGTSLPLVLEKCMIRIFVDALDECGEEAAGRLIRFFQYLHSKCSSIQHLGICFSCRHFPIITPENCLEICVEHENYQDIRRYIRGELRNAIHNPEELQTLQDKIEAQSNRVFQWAALVIPQNIPLELDDLYETIIRSLDVEDLPRSVRLLQWICFARRPLSLRELRCAMNVDTSSSYRSFSECRDLPNYIETDKHTEKHLQDLSGGLTEVKRHQEDTVVELIHQSVSDYLTIKGFRSLDSSLDSTDKAIGCAHVQLSTSCILYFTMDEITKPLISCMDKHPFLEYAVTSWLPHAQVAEEKGMLQANIPAFLQRLSAQALRYWVTLYSMTGQYPRPLIGTTMMHVASRYGLASIASAISDCRRGNIESNAKDNVGRTPLSWAAGEGHKAVVELLLARSGVEYGQTSLSWAARGGHEGVVRLLLARSDVETDSKDKHNQTPLFWAAREGHDAVVKLLLTRNNVEVELENENSQTPLLWAAKEGHKAVVELARSDVEVNSKDCNHRTPLWSEVTADQKNKDGQTPMSWAARGGHEAVVKLLLARSEVEVNSKDCNRRTPLWWAAWNGHEAVVKLLLTRSDAEADPKDRDGQTPLSWAAKEGYESLTKLLLARNDVEADSKNKIGQTPLFWAAKGGHEGVVKILLARSDVNVGSKDCYGQTPLLWAAEGGQDAVVQLLLARNEIKVDIEDCYGQTPLSWAAGRGHEVAAKLLLARSDVGANSKDGCGRTPLSWAAEGGHEAVVKLLLARNDIEADSRDRNGQTPLSWAAVEGYEGVVKLLLARSDVNPNSKDSDGQTPLSWAAREGRGAVVKMLLARGDVEVNSKDKIHRSPLLWAARAGHEAVVRLLLARDDVEFDREDLSRETPLSLAVD